MSRREHGVLRVGALVVLALCAWLPRGAISGAAEAPASSTVVTSATVVSPVRSGGAAGEARHATYASVAAVVPVALNSR